ncbi:MAG: hypothetical protein E6Q36_02870 [Chryseobacterium sp.]|nr:MAG: hypothetical protein E6Q36_02870 [Chryseobacterium sp.]
MNITVKLLRSYVKNGKDMFVYAVSATGKDLEAYKASQGDFYREDEQTKSPLWFSLNCIGDRGKLIITSKGKAIADMTAYKQAASLAKQFGGNLGQELARAQVQSLLGNVNPSTDEQPAEEQS